jgi:hypothetical protein
MNENQTIVPIGLIRAVFTSEFTPELFGGVDTHEPALRLVGQLVRHTPEDEAICAIVAAALPEAYSGDTLAELPRMIADARKKGFDKEPDAGRPEAGRKRRTTLDVLATLFVQKGAGLFHNDLRVPYVCIPTSSGGAINAPVGSDRCNHFLQEIYYRQTGRALKTRDRDEFTEHLRALAVFEGPKHPVFVRVGGDAQTVHHDLGRDDGAVVEITAKGYVITEKPAVKLIRMQGMKALPLPHPGPAPYSGLGKFKSLLLVDDDQWPMIVAFLIGALRPSGPHAFLAVEGEQGSGKSVRCELLKEAIDPSIPMRSSLPSSVQDLMIITNHSLVVIFDNLSGIRGEMSDALAALSTKAGFQTRQLYTDDQVHTIEISRPFMLNGIGDFIHRPDLMDRAIPLRFDAMPPNARRTEEQIRRDFEELLPELLHDLYTAVAHAIRNIGRTPAPTSIRMADAAHWVVAAEEGAGLVKGTILAALESAQSSMQADLATQDSLYAALEELLLRGEFRGRPSELLQLISPESRNHSDRYFPTNPSQPSSKLRRMRPALERAGIIVEFPERTREGRHIHVRMTEEAKKRVKEWAEERAEAARRDWPGSRPRY